LTARNIKPGAPFPQKETEETKMEYKGTKTQGILTIENTEGRISIFMHLEAASH
jgi:hypothetical protein